MIQSMHTIYYLLLIRVRKHMVIVGDVLVTNRIKEKYMEFIERRGIKHLSMKVSGMLSVIIQITPGALDYRNLSNIPTNIHGRDTTGSTFNTFANTSGLCAPQNTSSVLILSALLYSRRKSRVARQKKPRIQNLSHGESYSEICILFLLYSL